MSLAISVVSDVICPWCFVGKRRLERALDMLGLRGSSRVSWLPFELNPDMPPGGMERSRYRIAKFGAERAAELDARMAGIGREEGIAFSFDRMARTPNTRAAHALVTAAESEGATAQDRLVETLFRAYFERGLDVGDQAVLADLAAEVGLDPVRAAAAVRDPALTDEVAGLEEQSRRLGIAGVPFFIVDGRWTLSGAQTTESWIAALDARQASPEPRTREMAG